MERLLTERIGIGEVKAMAREMPTLTLWQHMLGTDPTASRNAAWVLTHKCDSDIATLPQDQLIELAMRTPSIPIRRLSLNLILRQPMREEDLRTDFLDFCLQHMIMLEEPSGVQALCMKLAHRMCQFYPELMHEFDATLKMIHIEYYKPGLKHLAGKISNTKQ